MRGTPNLAVFGSLQQRFIRAHAGNARRRGCKRQTSSVHPRACGERLRHMELGVASSGSSPRMRGTRLKSLERSLCNRFIPAHAGNACSRKDREAPPTVHPRACGERASQHVFSVSNAGSSPRMRGTRNHKRAVDFLRRFIPAHAGNALCRPRSLKSRPVHPRACGEREIRFHGSRSVVGSSPRMRRTPHDAHSPRGS